MIAPELRVLALAGLLQAAQYALMSLAANRDLGVAYTTGPRDAPPSRPLSPLAGRLSRALDNHAAALSLFTLAVAVTLLGPGSRPFTAACAWLYLAARLLYIPAYALGWAPWRSAIWGLGFLATLAMLFAALL